MNTDDIVEHILWPPVSLEFALIYVYDIAAARVKVQGTNRSDFRDIGTNICEIRRITLSAFIQNIRKYIVLLTMQGNFRTKYKQLRTTRFKIQKFYMVYALL